MIAAGVRNRVATTTPPPRRGPAIMKTKKKGQGENLGTHIPEGTMAGASQESLVKKGLDAALHQHYGSAMVSNYCPVSIGNYKIFPLLDTRCVRVLIFLPASSCALPLYLPL